MDMIVFELYGSMAHFRKIYSTSTSLSYFFPPRTTIIGILAGMLGRDRDSYYPEFSRDQCRVALSVREPMRKIVQTVNYLNTDTLDEMHLRGKYWREPRVPTTVEIVVSEEDAIRNPVKYRVFLHHKNQKIMDEISDILCNGRFHYPLSLGAAWCLGSAQFLGRVQAEIQCPERYVDISTVVPLSLLESVKIRRDLRIYREDNVPVSFHEGRILDSAEDYIFEHSGKEIPVKIHGETFTCKYGDGREVNGVFME